MQTKDRYNREEKKMIFMISLIINPCMTQEQKRLIILFAMQKLPKIEVALNTTDMNPAEIAVAAKAVHTTGDIDVISPSVTDATFSAKADTLIAHEAIRVTNPSAENTRISGELTSILKLDYEEMGLYVQSVANRVAVARGSVDAGEAVVLRCGFHLKKERVDHERKFEIVSSGTGWFKLRTHSFFVFSKNNRKLKFIFWRFPP